MTAKAGWYWSTSEDGPNYHGPHPTREEAIAEGVSEVDGRPIYVGKSSIVGVSVDADSVIDEWANGAGPDMLYEDALDYWCYQIPQKERDALSDELTEVFVKHLKKWGEQYEWAVIHDAEKVTPRAEGREEGEVVNGR